jgi:hypothetical protein
VAFGGSLCLLASAVGGQAAFAQSLPAVPDPLGEVRAKLGVELRHLSDQSYRQVSSDVLETIERGHR